MLIITGKSLYTKARSLYIPIKVDIELHRQTDVVQKVESVLKQYGDAHIGTFYEIGQHAPVAGINSGLKILAI